jgi:putative membrane protein (TIGR04086 family)
MNGERNAGPSFDLSAVGAGVLWGLMMMLTGSMLQGVLAYRSPLSPGAETVWTYIWQGLGALLAGYMAGRKAGGSGWLHGGMAGAGLAIVAAVVMGVLTAMPGMAGLMKALGGGAALGALAGILGVNLASGR